MAQLTIEVNGKPYVVGCEDGQEQHLRDIAALFDEQVRQISVEVGSLGETRLFLMAALMMADEMSDVKARLERLKAEQAERQAEQGRADVRAVAALEAAAKRIEALAVEVPTS
jgi:cell division protein ZapA